MEKKKTDAPLYGEILEQCVELLQKAQDHEEQKIRLLLQVGEKVDTLMNQTGEQEKLLKRLSRDISVRRGRLVLPAELKEFRQLYLSFGETFYNGTPGKLVTGQTLEALRELVRNRVKKKSHDRKSVPLNVVKKINNHIRNLLSKLEEWNPDEGEIQEFRDQVEVMKALIFDVVKFVNVLGTSKQLSLFSVDELRR